jgi:hypothetical protein
MAHPQEARISCNECNGWYNSERELYEHMQTAHRRCVSEQSTLQHGGTLPDGFEKSLGTSKEEWAKLSVQLRNRVQVLFNSKELEAVDRFILLASQGPIFDDVRRQAQLVKHC